MLDGKFLAVQLHFLWSTNYFRSVLNNHVNQASVSRKRLLETSIVVPPIAEQLRIVEALEEKFSRLDAASAVLNMVGSKGFALRKRMVSAVIGGQRRTAGSEDDVTQFLSQVDKQVARVAGKKRWAQVRNPEATGLYGIPPGWSWRTLGSLCLDIQYGTSAKTSPKVNADDVPVIRMGNIQGGELDLEDLKFLPVNHADVEKCILRDGDLLFNRTNSAELVGKSAVFRVKMGPAVYASYLIRCRFADGIDPDWVNAVVNSNFGRRYIASVVTQQVGQANVNSAKMALMPIPVPPPAEQREALKVLRDWESALTHPQLAAAAAVKRAEGLKSAILRKAFNGDLVPQNRSDEPAATLLARITAEREATTPVRKAAKRAARPRKATAAAAATKAAPAPTPAPSASVQQELFDQ
ncbi:restriction endonuclease subunit S [Streptomyces sp. NPDC086787]|uniref:restriction endonuclease subunit S n=1 Tax=Streptomyces sp. NPDC086787 TaxID=3365759 RepID=UPI003806130E